MKPDGAKTPSRIEDDTPILPDVIADAVVRELARYLRAAHGYCLIPSAHETLTRKLADRANQFYQARPDWRKKVKRNPTYGRDYLYCFMRHWLAGELIGQSVYKLIPASFANGLKLPAS